MVNRSASKQMAYPTASLMKAKIVLVSLRFKPAFVSHLVAFAKAFQELGLETELVVDLPYAHFPELTALAPVTTYPAAQLKNSYTHALFANVSLQNRQFASRLKSGGAKILYLYHEPWHSFFDFFNGEGIRGGLTGALAHRVSVPMLKLADAVILPSRYATHVYGENDVRYNRNSSYLPLLFDDETHGRLQEEPGKRRYFSYIGGICRAHGFDQYVAFMRDALARRPDMRFLIASRLPLPSYVLKDDLIRRNLDRVEMRCGRPLQNEEINRCYRESFCVWNLYRRSTQSGVLPKAFMFGAPVIANQAGSFPEFITDGLNGKFALAEDLSGIAAVLEDIREHPGEYAANCRKTFLETFFYRANLPQLDRLLAN